MKWIEVVIFLPNLVLALATAQQAYVPQLVEICNSSTTIVCVNNFAAVLPYHFNRSATPGIFSSDKLSAIEVADSSWSLLRGADFVVFDRLRANDILAGEPSYKFMFELDDAVHEAPVYAPATNKLYFSELRGDKTPPGFLPQRVIDLNTEPPTLGQLLSDPPIYAPNGGTIHNGLIYWGVSGGNSSIDGIEVRPGIATLDPMTNRTVTLLNNYFGYYFNTVDDLFVDEKGDVWFTDPEYSWFNALTDTAPQLGAASYRFRPSTGAVSIVEDTLIQPNGIALSPQKPDSSVTEGRTVYISDTGALTGTIVQSLGHQGTSWNATGKRTIYAFDLSLDGNYLLNKRPIYLAQEGLPDGLKVARNGYVVTGAGQGVDVIDPKDGTLILRVQTNFTVQNFAWTGEDFEDLWMVGNSGAARVRWQLQGQKLT